VEVEDGTKPFVILFMLVPLFEMITGCSIMLLFPDIPIFATYFIPASARHWFKYYFILFELIAKTVAWTNCVFYAFLTVVFLESTHFWVGQLR
jgi:hypothetical protein